MNFFIFILSVFIYLTIVLAHTKVAVCDKCVRRDECELFQYMSPAQKFAWAFKYPCSTHHKKYNTPYTNGNLVCCSESLWAAETEYSYDEDKIPKPQHPDIIDEGTEQQIFEILENYNPPGKGAAPGSSNVDSVLGSPYVSIKPEVINVPTTGPPKVNYNTLPPSLTNSQSQCLPSIFPPNPETECCGLEASESERMFFASTTARPIYQIPPYVLLPEKSPTDTGVPISKPADKKFNMTIDTRISGGHETNFYQFPWTAQLISTFDYGTRRSSFDCGGSLISSRYILTAGHCVYDAAGTLTQVEAYLAEYDRTTFPKDCKNVINYGQQCIDNVIIDAEEVILHPRYKDDNLSNDIALIRLQQNAPYTAFIRPICLTPIDMDNTNFANTRLAVAGWGRNGRYRSNIKQSTVVNLVPQEECKKYYPSLLRTQMCAVGYSGEDTCKGDSGGPLMTGNGGKYYVVGIVSGKRADAPCGTAVPSLYTNVYHYVDWIVNNIRD